MNMQYRSISEKRGINQLKGVQEFLKSWALSRDYPLNENLPVAISSFGNINYFGVRDGSYAPLHTPSSVNFVDRVEKRVLPLVESLVSRGFVTYTSCEGHYYNSEDVLPKELHVGLILEPESSKQKFLKVAALLQATDLSLASGTKVEIYLGMLLDSLTGKEHQVGDIYLEREASVSWAEYFDGLDDAVRKIADLIEFASL